MRQGLIMSRRSSFRDLVSAVDELREAAEPLMQHAAAREVSVRFMCRVLVTNRCNYHGWVRAQHKRREREYDDQQLTELIFEVHTAHPA